jgi:mono/diheme cytochrome c family protein
MRGKRQQMILNEFHNNNRTANIPLVAASLALLILCSAAQAQDPAERGRALLTEFCSRCHAIRTTDKSRNRLAPPLRILGRSFDLDQFSQLLERGISSSHPDMPEFKFSEDDARAVTVYLRSIQQ